MIKLNELKNIVNLFNDCELELYTNLENNYCEVSLDSLISVEKYINVNQMLHPDYCIYINYDENLVIFDESGLEYLGFFR